MTTPENIPSSKTFVDRKGTKWDLTLTFAGAKRIDNSDFSEITDKEFSILRPDQKLFNEVLTDIPLLFGMIWALVQPQVCDKLSIDPQIQPQEAENEFLDRLNGKAIEAARQAFWRALADFFPSQQAALLILMRQYERAQERLVVELNGMETEIEDLINSEITTEVTRIRQEFQHSPSKS